MDARKTLETAVLILALIIGVKIGQRATATV